MKNKKRVNKNRSKNNKRVKGFTLIELLATITIVGVLMLIAIPSVSRIIEKSRANLYISTIKQYIQAVKIRVANDGLDCDGSSISGAPEGYYYYLSFDSSNSSGQDLLESGGKSPYGNSDVKGVILMHKSAKGYKYYIAIVDSSGRGYGNYQGHEYKAVSLISESEIKVSNLSFPICGKKFYENDYLEEPFYLENGICVGYNTLCDINSERTSGSLVKKCELN